MKDLIMLHFSIFYMNFTCKKYNFAASICILFSDDLQTILVHSLKTIFFLIS